MVDARTLHESVAAWYARNARVLPWRGIDDPYAILVSEVMLQQTQVERVIPKFRAFLDAFPTLRALAGAQPADVIRVWAGMGYNGRAVRLHRLARDVMERLGGELPSTAEELRKLPGIGPYTAAAVASFAYGEPVAVLDTNIYRVLSRVVHGVEAPSRDALHPIAEELLPQAGSPITSADWHQALMDVGATLCTARQPRCMLCPLRPHCAAAPHLQSGSDPALAEASVPYAPRQSRFQGSARYFRGRIVGYLREQPDTGVDESALEAVLRDAETASGAACPVSLPDLLAALERDGLVRCEGTRVRLP
ncbi:MAG: A/G-specific adenine glycosylase [Chloroflexota bacterium]|nr:A/G-specific adenine glycosylase [Chloroflexota bacterium]MDE2883484.1 A/G-specific adenine glycosylase [Chloroflexota bacterium]